MKPVDKAIFYIEHVLKTNGADYLRSHATQLSWWKIHMIDIGLFFFFFVAIVVLVSGLLVMFLLKYFRFAKRNNQDGKLKIPKTRKAKKIQ
jgi:hypothetical protein